MDNPGLPTILLNLFTLVILAITAYISWQSNKLMKTINDQQIERERVTAFIALANQLSTIRKIDPNQPNWDDAAESINKLELIAILYEAEMANREYLYRLLSDLFIEVYEQIYTARDIETKEEKGILLIEQCPKVTSLYKIWKPERAKLRPLMDRFQPTVENQVKGLINNESNRSQGKDDAAR